VSQDVAEASLYEALDAGINHVDVAASYGEAELRLGPMMSDIRGRIFLATKTGDRLATTRGARSTPRSSGCRPTGSTCCSCTPSAPWTS
jgi:aryl-alcohol dehydrogenase-like predicted oxidoreductase